MTQQLRLKLCPSCKGLGTKLPDEKNMNPKEAHCKICENTGSVLVGQRCRCGRPLRAVHHERNLAFCGSSNTCKGVEASDALRKLLPTVI